jgi:hypothetical protein
MVRATALTPLPKLCREAEDNLAHDMRARPMGSDVGERSLRVRNASPPRAFERGNRR